MLFLRPFDDVLNSFVVSVVGGADGGVSSDICGMVVEPFVQLTAGRRTHNLTKSAANMTTELWRFCNQLMKLAKQLGTMFVAVASMSADARHNIMIISSLHHLSARAQLVWSPFQLPLRCCTTFWTGILCCCFFIA